METKYLLKSEQIITQSDQNIITLSNLRVRYSAKALGQAHIVSIMLKKVGSIELKYKNNLLLLLLAVIGALVALYGFSENDTEILFSKSYWNGNMHLFLYQEPKACSFPLPQKVVKKFYFIQRNET